MSIIYNSNQQTNNNNNPVTTILGTQDLRKADECRNGNIRSRTLNGGFVAWPENISATCRNNVEIISENRTRSGGFIAWPG